MKWLTWPGGGAVGGDSDGHQDGAGLLAPAVHRHHRQHVGARHLGQGPFLGLSNRKAAEAGFQTLFLFYF